MDLLIVYRLSYFSALKTEALYYVVNSVDFCCAAWRYILENITVHSFIVKHVVPEVFLSRCNASERHFHAAVL